MKKSCLAILISVLSFAISCAQIEVNNQNTTIQIKFLDPNHNKLKIPTCNLDSILYKIHLSSLQNDLFKELDSFFELASFTEESYIKLFETRELNATAFNPSLKMINDALTSLKINFETWDNFANRYRIFDNSDYCEISKNFKKAYSILFEQVKKNCEDIKDCIDIKTQIKNSHQYIVNLINEVKIFLKS